MAVTPLNEIVVSSDLELTPDVLGDLASATVLAALKVEKVTLTVCAAVTQNAQLLIVTGKLADFVGRKAANLDVRLYLFEVPTIQATTERHALLLIGELPADYHVNDLWNAYASGGPSAVTKVLGSSTFVDQLLLLSTLDYHSTSYIHPPFPPAQDKLSSSQQTFIANLAKQLSYVTRGFTYWIKTSLVDQTTQDALALLSANAIFQPQTFLSQTNFENDSANLVLFYTFDDPAKPKDNVHFGFEFESIGLGFPLGETQTVLPQIQLRGAITIGARLELEADFNPSTKYLTLDLTGFPGFGDLIDQFSKEFDLNTQLGTFLPGGDFKGLGSITLEELKIGVDFDNRVVDLVGFVIAAEKNLSLIGDLVEVQPALTAQINSPFDGDNRTFEVDVYGRWLIEHAEIDTALVVSSDGYRVTAGLALGQSFGLSSLLGGLLGGQVEGIPNLDVTGFEFIGFKSDSDTYYEVELDLAAGWHLGDLPLTLDEVHLEATLSNGELSEAGLSATLELSDVHFRLAAEYNPDNRGWTFSGGTTPGETIKVGKFIGALAKDLGADPHNDFLQPFEEIEITGLYVEYRTYEGQSSQLSLFLSLQDKANFGNFLPLNQILVRFQTNGSGTMWRFDATADGTPPDASTLLQHINKTHSVAVSLPESLASLQIKEVSGFYDSSLGNYGFSTYLKFGDSASVYVQINLIKQGTGKDAKLEKDVRGQLVFNEGAKDELTFALDLVSTSESTDFVAAYESTGATPLSLGSLIKAITGGDDNLDDLRIDIRNALFSHHQQKGKDGKSIFAIDMDAGINLSSLGNLPLVGTELAAAKTLTLAFQIVYATDNYTTTELKALNATLSDKATFKFPEAADIAKQSPDVNAQLRLGAGETYAVNLPVGLDKDSGQLKKTGTQAAAGDDSSIHWFDINKAFGPLHLNRVGFEVAMSGGVAVTGHLDGGLSLMGLSVELLDLTVTTTLTGTNKFKPVFGLNGLGIDFKNGPLEIGGALYKQTKNGLTEFDGIAIIRTEALQLSAIGSFAELAGGHKSLFIYAVLNYPLGGPGFFFVTGLAAGFGYNRQLLIPDIGDLQQFPLISEAMAATPAPPPTDMSQMKDFISGKISAMESYIPPQVGEYFLAVGVRFKSFELLDSFALLTVQFGEHFEVDVLGISTMLIPPKVPETPIAEAQLLLKATIIPDEGIVLVQAQLTNNSYIFSRDCHLTGGFAFASWFKGDHAGDFVVSIGGYHPDFKTPSYYPVVPRVGFNWAVSSELTVKGGGYFALVPHAIMAGGSLDAQFQSGDVRAWFNLNANFLLMWKPFHYDAQLSVSMGAEVTIHFFGTHHIGLEASADLHLWGPEFGGHARVSVTIIGITFHFSIDFGASPSPPAPIGWEDFRSTFIPANDKIASLTIEKGLERTIQVKGEPDVLIINRKELSIVTSSVLPIKSLSGSFAHESDAQFGVAPMNQAAVTASEHQVMFSGKASELSMTPITQPVPSALWGQKMEAQLNPAQSMVAAMTGIRLTPAKPSQPGPTETVRRDQLAYDTTPVTDGYRLGALKPFNVTNAKATWSDVETNMLSTNVVDARNSLLTAMGFDPGQLISNQPFSEDTIYPPQYGEIEVK
jgi:hypothetical protein